jgi:hypothetical protein
MVEFLLGIDTYTAQLSQAGYFQTVLQSAAAGGHVPMVDFLIGEDTYAVDVNEVGACFDTNDPDDSMTRN